MNEKLSNKELQKLLFIHNAINDGWKVHKKSEHYIFSKKHNNEKLFFDNNYIYNFVNKNIKNNNKNIE